MTRKLFSTALSLLCFVLMLCALAATLGMHLLGDLKTYVQISLKNVEETTGYRITLADIGWDIFEGTGIRADNLVLYDAAGKVPVLECRTAHFKFDILPLVKAKLIISRIILDAPLITIHRDNKGAWTQPRLPAPAETVSMNGLDAFSDFSISLKKIYINDGRFRFDDRLRNVRFDLENIRLQVLRDKQSGAYNLTITANQQPEDGGSAAFTGVFQGIDAQGRTEHLTGSGTLALKGAKLLRLASYVYDNATWAEMRSSLNADLGVKLEPDWHFLLRGTMDSDNLTVPIPGGRLLPLGNTSFAGSARASSGLFLLENFKLTIADNATLAGKCSLTRMSESTGYLELKCYSNRIRVTTIAKLATAFEALPQQAKEILANTHRGEIALTDAHILTNVGHMPAETHSTLTGQFQLYDVISFFSQKFPPLRIAHGTMNLRDDETVEAELAAQWPGTDNHTLHAKVESIFHGPQLSLQADSVLSAEGSAGILKAAAPELAEKISMVSGIISAKTQMTYAQEADVSASFDVQQASVTALDRINKPEGVPLRLEVKTTVANAASPPLPLSFTVVSGDALRLDGKVKSWEPFACNGTYRADNLDLSSFAIKDIKGLAEVSGRVSGTGDWKLPVGDTAQFPVQGAFSLKDFTLVVTSNGKLLVGGYLDGTFESTALKILSCRATMGETTGTFSGRLTTLLPPRGRVDIAADMFDIDDFVNVIDNFTSINDQIKLRRKEPATPPRTPEMLLLADLDMPLKLKRLNLWNWDLDNGTSIWTLKNGIMHWDNVTLIGGGGPITGTVMFDLSTLPVRTLTLSPSRSQSDFLFVVPALRKNRTITGTMDMNGWFSSTFSRKEELGRNMDGKFHIDVADGKIQKLTIISKILELMDITNLFGFVSNDIFSTGMPYDTIKADFTVDHGVMRTENLQLKGPAMNLSAVGTINMGTEDMNLIIGAHVLETFGKIVGYIPLAGSIVTGKDKTITLAYFKATGSYQNASVMPMPVKSLSAPILKIINSFLYFPKKLLNTASESDNASNAGAQ
jgi:hypothetical protein